MTNKVTKTLTDATNQLIHGNKLGKTLTKAEQLAWIGERHPDLTRKKISEILETVIELWDLHIKSEQDYVWPGLFKLQVVKKPGRGEETKNNPFTGKPMVIKARPPYKTVRIKPLKKLKNMASDIEISQQGADLA
jgi:nucleoid DNA-binding protein